MADRVILLAGERCKGETRRAVQGCNDYLRMGPARSLRSLATQYAEGDKSLAPTRSLPTLWRWSARYNWQARADLYDVQLEEAKNAYAAQVLADGLALTHERVVKLKELADQLEGYLHNPDDVWLPDVKQIGAGENTERVDIVRFNAPLIEQFRATLDDLAKETGGRRQALDLLSGGLPFKAYVNISPDDWDDDSDGEEAP